MIPRIIKYLRRHQLLTLLLISIACNFMQLSAFVKRCEANAVLNYRLMVSEQANDSLRMADVKYYTVR